MFKIVDGVLVINSKLGTFGYAAKCWGPIVVCPKDQEERFLKHEIQHSRDWRKAPFTSPFKYYFNWKYRFWWELRGYFHNPEMNSRDIAEILNRKYGLKQWITPLMIEDLMTICTKFSFKGCLTTINLVIISK